MKSSWRVLMVVFALAAHLSGEESDSTHLANWHQWRGPNANGVAPQANPPVTWGEEGNLAWKTPIPGEGSASPIVWNDRVFVAAAVPTDRHDPNISRTPREGQKTPLPNNVHQFQLFCIDRADGRARWKRTAVESIPHEGRHRTNTYASASPVTDGQHVFVSFGSFGVFAYDMEGELVWQRDLGNMRTRYGWGEGASPALYKETLLVNWDQEDESFLVALDARTGDTLWKVERDEPTSWSTPLIVEHGGRVQAVISATNRIRGYDLSDGQLIWQCGGLTTNVISSPVAEDGTVYCVSNYGDAAALAIPLDAQGDITDSDTLSWSHRRGTPYCPSPLLYHGRLYFTSRNSTPLTCLDAKTGDAVVDMVRLPGLSGNIYASPVAAAGRIYFTDRAGTTLVVSEAPELKVLAVNQLNEPVDASPAIVGNQILIRARHHLYCFVRHAP